MGQPGEQFFASIMMDNGLADDGAKRRHAVRQPLRHPAAVQGKVGAAAGTGHKVEFLPNRD
jgi:hypothetical protein